MANDERQLINERRQYWQAIEAVRPGERFVLFDTQRARTQVRYTDHQTFGGLKTSIRLESGSLGRLNISVTAAPYTRSQHAIINPFDRAQGYPLDKDDLTLPSRIVKAGKLHQEDEHPLDGLYLFAFVAPEDLLLNGLVLAYIQHAEGERDGQAAEPGPDLTTLLSHLFLVLSFPNGASFSARATYHARQRLIQFNTFFPSDTGPLPTLEGSPAPLTKNAALEASILAGQRGARREGFDLLLPFDLERLRTIQAHFLVLAALD